jgi:hypothetical protein
VELVPHSKGVSEEIDEKYVTKERRNDKELERCI